MHPTRARLLGRAAFVVLLLLVTWNVWIALKLRTELGAASSERQFWIIGHAAYPAPQRADAFVGLALAGNREWKGAHLDGLNLFGLRLPGAELNEANLTGSDLRQAVLSNARLHRAILSRTDLTAADLSQAFATGAEVVLARMIGANCRQANFSGGTLEQIEGMNASFVAADLSETDLLMANLTGANLAGADLSGSQLEATRLVGANLNLARVPGVMIKDADFSNANWWRARGFTSAQLNELKERFPPTADAPQALRDDYAKWLGELNGDLPPRKP